MNVIPLSTYIEKVKNNGIITLGRKRTASSWKISDWLYAGRVQKTGMF